MCKGPEIGEILWWEKREKTCLTRASRGRRGTGEACGQGRSQIMLQLSSLGRILRKAGSLWRASVVKRYSPP